MPCPSREGEPLARSQETSPFAPPADPSREGWWRCASRRRRSPISAPSGVGLFAMRRWAHRTHLAGFLACIATACGTGNRAPPSGGITVTDDARRPPRPGRTPPPRAAGAPRPVARPARHIVSLLPSFTELLFAMGAGDRLV